MSNPLVSYIIPSYNHAPYIEQAINSVLKQTYENIELIIVDDGSKDDTHQVLEQFKEYPNITILFNKKNLGQSASLNKGLNVAKGDYIGLLPSDDWLLKDKVKLQMVKFSECDSNVGMIYGKGIRHFQYADGTTKDIVTEGDMERGYLAESLIKRGNFIYPITPLFKRECFEKCPPDESYRAEGESIYLKMGLYFKFDYIDDVVAVMRDHPNNTGKMTDLMYADNLRYLQEYFAIPGLPASIKQYETIKIANLKKIKSMEFMVSKFEFSRGRKLALEALKLDKSNMKNPKFIFAILITYLPKTLSKLIINRLHKKKESI